MINILKKTLESLIKKEKSFIHLIVFQQVTFIRKLKILSIQLILKWRASSLSFSRMGNTQGGESVTQKFSEMAQQKSQQFSQDIQAKTQELKHKIMNGG